MQAVANAIAERISSISESSTMKVAADAVPGLRVVATGGAEGRLAVYRQIDQIDVIPAYAIARVGGGRIWDFSVRLIKGLTWVYFVGDRRLVTDSV